MSLQRVKKERKRRAAMKEEIKKILRPDMSQAGKAYVKIDFNQSISEVLEGWLFKDQRLGRSRRGELELENN